MGPNPRQLWIVVALLLMVGCEDSSTAPATSTPASALKPTPDPQSDPRVPRVAETGPGLVPSRPVAEVESSIPATWQTQKVPTLNGKPMVDAKYLVRSDLGDIQVTMGLVSGGAEANIDRWINQVESEPQKKPIRKQRTIGGIDSQMVDCSGNFSGHLLNSIPSRNCRLIGVLIPREQKHLAIKLVGPAGAVASYYEEFDRFLDSLTFEQ